MPPARTVFKRFRQTAERWPERPFLNVLPETAEIYEIPSGSWTYGTALIEAERFAERYMAAGYGPGTRVGLLLENRPDFFRHWLALNACGAGIVPINPDLRTAELEHLATDSGLASVVARPERHEALRQATGRPVVTPNDPPVKVAGPKQAPGHRTECALLYTSGTTGKPKGCILDNAYFLTAGHWYATVGGALALHEEPMERMLTPLPLFHVNALAFSVMAMIETGGCLAILDRFHPSTWWESVAAHEATVIHYLGIMPPLLMNLEAHPKERNHAVRFGFGAGIPPDLHTAAEHRFGFPLIEGWAMTETGAGGVIMATAEPRKPGTACFGRPRGTVEARVVLDDGAEAPPNVPGELLVRSTGPTGGDGFFRGYLNQPEATAEAWAGGWLHTGDIVSRDGDGDLHFIDRKKNIVRRSGENVSAVEVEGILMKNKDVSSVAIAPVPDPVRGEEVAALVVSNAGTSADTAARISAWALQQMAYFKVPGWIAFVDELPLTATEKLQRGALRALAAALVTDGSAHDLRASKRRGA